MAGYFGKSHTLPHFLEIRAHGVEQTESRGKALLTREKRTQGRTGGKNWVSLLVWNYPPVATAVDWNNFLICGTVMPSF